MIYLIEFIIIQKIVSIFSKVLNRATESKVQNRDIYTTSSVVRLKSEYMKIGNFEKF